MLCNTITFQRRRVIQPSKSVPTFTDFGRKLNEISQISQKLPRSAIVVVCRQCSSLVAKVEHLEKKLNDARSKIVHLGAITLNAKPFFSRARRHSSSSSHAASAPK